MVLFNPIILLFVFYFNIQLVSSFQIGHRSKYHTIRLSSSPPSSPLSKPSQRIHHLSLSFKVNDDDDVKAVIPKKKRVVSSTPIKNLIPVNTLEEYLSLMNEHKEDVVVIRFYAPWCKSCAAIAPSFHRLARRNPNTIFVDIAATAKNSDLHESLNVPYVPYGHIYGSDQLVDEMKISKNDWKKFERKVKNMVRGFCDLEDIQVGADNLPF